ncbi:cyclic nucleotide-gated ion channel 1-like [Pistacia vera]|uniref:cyclic nucleotide-gated ion channel 1-like n=1 Tax=Pistacia vera TaxID=55513 RepID=UPI001263CF3C|nr:cyclic nucleotide-gated ion channel 1-like [Pistacia vera]
MADQAPYPSVRLNIGQGNQTNSGTGNSQRSPQHSKYENHGAKGIWRLTFWAIGILLDPLVLYTFFVGDDRKWVLVDKKFGMTIFVVHTVVDIINVILYMKLELRDDLQKAKGAGIHHTCWSIVCMFPFSVVMLILIPITKTRVVLHGVIMTFLLQTLPRVVRLFILSAEAIPPSATLGLWLLKFFYLYVCSGQGIGALWYLLAIDTETRCWAKACGTHNYDRFLRCNESLEAYKIMNDFCSRNTTEYDFGVFRDAHQSGILEMRGFAIKILYCFQWAMQNISGFGSNIEAVGTDVLGNFFVLIIIYTAVILFYFLLGQMQVYLQSNTKKLKKGEEKLRETKQSTHFKKLSKDLQTEVISEKRKESETGDTEGANIENLFDDLSEDLRNDMTKEFCVELLKQVEEFQNWNDASLDDLCAYLKPVFFSEQTCIIRENDPIHKMIFVVQGKLWIYTSDSNEDSTNDSSNTVLDRQRNDPLKEVVFCGEELLNRLRTNPSTSKLPVSKRTIQALTNVDAFALMAYDLKNILINRRS